MNGLADLTGNKYGTIRVQGLVARRPEPRYSIVCEQCGTTSTATHTRLRDGAVRCQYAGCGKQTKQVRPDLLSEQNRQVAERENQRRADELAASARRMEAESEGWERPERYTPTAEPYQPMSQRERIALRARREAEEQERHEAERPRLEAERRTSEKIAQAEEQLRTTASQLARAKRDQIANGMDDEFVVDPATMTGTGIPPSEVDAWHQSQFAEFLQNNPGYFKCDENASALTSYLMRNCPGLVLISATQLTAAYKRLSEYGLLRQRPAPQPAPQSKEVNLTIAPSQSPQKQHSVIYEGWDEDGNPRQYSDREVSKWSSGEMKRRLRLTAASGALSLPNVGPGPSGYA